MSVYIRKFLLVSLFFLAYNALNGQTNQEYLIKWDPQDTLVYEVYMGAVNLETSVANNSSSISKKELQTFEDTLSVFVQALMEPLLEELSQYPIEMIVAPYGENIYSLMTFGGHPFLEALVDKHGTLQSEIPQKSVNIYKIFMATPTIPVKVGDTWQPILESGISFTTMVPSDSSKFKQSVLSRIDNVDNEKVAVISTLLKETYKGKAQNDEGQEVDQHFEVTVSSIMHFSLDRNVLIAVDGLVYYHNKLNDYKQEDRYSMKLKQ